MPAELPGFYYDEEKKKYFRIQKNHVLPQQSGVHTRQSVQAVREQKQIEGEQRRQSHRYHAGHVRRSAVATSLSYNLLDHHIGNQRRPRPLIADYFAQNLSSRSAYGSNSSGIPTSNTFPAASFCIYKDGCLATTVDKPVRYFRHDVPNRPLAQGGYAYSMAPDTEDEIQRLRDGLDPDVEIMAGFQIGMKCILLASNGKTQLDLYNVQGGQLSRREYDLGGDTVVWDVAASPFRYDAAVATTNRLILIDCENNIFSSRHSKPQMNVHFKDANLIVSSGRSGVVNFFDQRSQDSVARLQHSSAVLGTHRTKRPEQLVVHGFFSTSIYDLRYAKAKTTAMKINLYTSDRHRGPRHHLPKSFNSGSNRTTTVRKHQHRTIHPPPAPAQGPYSEPYIDFAIPQSRYTDRYSYGRKQAYSEDLDAVILSSSNSSMPSAAEAGSTGSHYVTLYSAATGKPLKSPALSNKSFKCPVTCVDIVNLRNGPESIFTLGGGELLEWTIHHGFDDDVDLAV